MSKSTIYKGISLQRLIDCLERQFTAAERKKLKVYVSSDEELNNIYRDFYIDINKSEGYIALAGLDGTELN